MKHSRRHFFKLLAVGASGAAGGTAAAILTDKPGDLDRNIKAGVFLGAAGATLAIGIPRGEFTPDTKETKDGERGRHQEREDANRADRENRYKERD